MPTYLRTHSLTCQLTYFLYQYRAAVWRKFKREEQGEIVLELTSSSVDMPALRACAPSQCASLIALVFSTCVGLGRIQQAYDAVVKLEAHAAAEREAASNMPSAVVDRFAERRSDCLRSLVSTLHSRGALHVLAGLLDAPASPSPSAALGLARKAVEVELHKALVEHARSTSVVPAAAATVSSPPSQVTAHQADPDQP